ncbi:hypothetical protein AXG93_1860s1190 [Marchantia polymorpha subsp. ruderalis]|uniref:Phytanoyl-CoA dioxygenase n=1 Tax=Marchantia polymorpha subsp. ruderalis TaxID=1480154 RepID=A0A176VEQ0_MARPO|nr:hypothetical protein AXG93_1860s1190 [Marchantia polymorpha subsp. ruderalis]
MASSILIPSLRPLAIKSRCFASSTAVVPRLSEEAVKQFEEDGATVVRQFFSPEWVEHLREAAELNMKNPGPLCDEHVKPGQVLLERELFNEQRFYSFNRLLKSNVRPGRFHDDQFLWIRSEAMKRFIFESPAGELAKQLSTETATPWHNDHSYWPLKGNQVISLWLALDHVPKSCCIEYVKGSHKWELLHKLTSFSGDQDRYKAANVTSVAEIPDIDSMRDQVELLSWDLEPGDCLVHHSFAVHGAPGISSSGNRRRAYATRWAGDDVRYDPRPGTMEFMWKEKAGVDAKLPPGSPLESPLFPTVV